MSTVRTNNVQVGQSLTATNNFTLYQPTVPDGTVRLGVGNTGATTLDAVTVNSAGNVAVPSLTVNSNNISSVNSLGFRNRLINSDMRIDQRNAGAAVTGANAFPVDRFLTGFSFDGVVSAQRATIAPAGFTNSLGFTVTTPDTSIGATQFYVFRQRIEGFNIADLGWGAAGAQTVTLSFWVRSSITGTYGATISNAADSRLYPISYTINSANTWEQKTIVVPGDTTGTWATDNSTGIQVQFHLALGSSYQGATNAWNASSIYGPTGMVNWTGTNGATFYITGVQLEAGSVATPFERRDYGRELIMCQRYFCSSFPIGTAIANGVNAAAVIRNIVPYSSNSSYSDNVEFPVSMRAAPTVTIYSQGAVAGSTGFNYFDGLWRAATASDVYGANTFGFHVEPSGSYTAFVPRLGAFAFAASAEL